MSTPKKNGNGNGNGHKNGLNGHANGEAAGNGNGNGLSRRVSRVIIQAGGRGTRLQPYTTVLPKPLMPVTEFPILEIMIRQLVQQGFPRITITLGHLGHLIMAVVGDGSQWGAEIDYVREDQPRGTIGAITLVRDLDGPFLVMNGDLLTDFNYAAFLANHLESGAQLSVGIYQKEVPISLGVFDLANDRRIVGFREKPTLFFPCSMGIYAFSPELLDLIPRDGNFGFDDLMGLCLSRNIRIYAHPFRGLWLDIGRPEDYSNATRLFHENRARLLPETAGSMRPNGVLRRHPAAVPQPKESPRHSR
jgi:NDP-sugar pyrophosphorylase family protein